MKSSNVNYCLEGHKTTFTQDLVFSLFMLSVEKTLKAALSCLVTHSAGLFNYSIVIFSMASSFTIPQLIGFVHMSETEHIAATYTHTHTHTHHACTLAAEREGQDVCEHTDGAGRGASSED